MNKIWFTSDTHFGSERTLQLSKRPFNSVVDMDLTMIHNWNKVVNKNDTVYHLGDFGNFECIQYLNGNINLIPGNYDKKDLNLLSVLDNPNNISERFHLLRNIEILNIAYNDKEYKLFLAHEPTLLCNKKYKDNEFALFGHIHKLCMVKPFGLNVGIDCHTAPIDLDTVMFYMNGIKKYYDENVFC